ncbi:MAG: hypothetical protein Ct9H90mP3_8770 [Flammeovirgaceae bacterium]|nr:MAG: hypothetical protein Ct9H90mP3_8770 [Flammeovirgaceae bacterium]
MKILVMGGTRFFGKSLVGKLLSKNYDIDIFTRGNKSNPKKTNLIKGNRNNSEDIVKLRKKKYDVFFDISGRELEQTKLLIENLDNSFQRYIYVSSAGVYKDNCELPLSEVDPIDPENRHKGKFETENWLKKPKKISLFQVLDLLIFMDQEIIIKLKIGFFKGYLPKNQYQSLVTVL